MQVILDQKHYLEERNRQLTEANNSLRSELKRKQEDNNHAANADSDSVSLKSLTFTQRLGDLERERELLEVRLGEKEDALRLAQQQLHDTMMLNEDLYDKLRQAESRLKRVQRDLSTLKETHARVSYFSQPKNAHHNRDYSNCRNWMS